MRRGMALILVVGVLALLSLGSVAFVSMTMLERRAAGQRLHAARAGLLARSGLEDLRARLEAGQDPQASGVRYGGEDWDADGILDAAPVAEDVHVPGGSPAPEVSACPVRLALRPAFFRRASGGFPDLRTVEGRQAGYSGDLGGATFSTAFSGRGLWVNGGDPAAAAASGYNAVLRRMLGTLAEALDREDGLDDGIPVDQADGWKLVDLRPSPGGWISLAQIRALALGGSAAKLEALAPDLCLSAEPDLKVIRPTAQAAFLGTRPKSLAQIRAANGLPGFETSGAKIVGRAPVDLTYARGRRPLLLALFSGLSGIWLDETAAENLVGFDNLGILKKVDLLNTWTPADDAHVAAQALLAWTGPLGTWAEWDAFCDTVAFPGTPDEVLAKRDLLKGHFNPNSDLCKANPDRTLSRRVDKADLLAYSTEFSLLPRAAGRASCAGRVTDAKGRLQACRTLSAELACDHVLTLTTQREFVAGNLGDPARAGDESALRAYGQSPYISFSAGVTDTFGVRLFGAKGMALQTSPENHLAPPADWDGQVRLGTIEGAPPAAAPGALRFQACWDDAFDADPPSAAPACAFDASQAPAAAPLYSGGSLLPDGCYAELGREPGYPCAGNLLDARGAFSFWVKPSYDVSKTSTGLAGNRRRHLYLNATRTDGNPLNTQVFQILNTNGAGGGLFASRPIAFTIFWENLRAPYGTPPASDATVLGGTQQINWTPDREPWILPHRWYLLTMMWDFDEPTAGVGTQIWVDAGMGPAGTSLDRNGTVGCYYYLNMAAATHGLTAPDGLASAVFYLGRRGNGMSFLGSTDNRFFGPADATFDELAFYDLSTPASTAATAARALARQRFAEGRCYKESAYPASGGLLTASGPARNAGEYFSAPIDLSGARLLRLAWTQGVPRELKAPAAPGWPAPILPDKLEDGDPGPDGEILLELSDASGGAYASDALGVPIGTLFRNAAGAWVGRTPSAPFRLHAVFRPNLDPLKESQRAILEPLVLDDVTLVYRRPGEEGLRSFEELF